MSFIRILRITQSLAVGGKATLEHGGGGGEDVGIS